VPWNILPKVLDTSGHFGTLKSDILKLGEEISIPISAICADNHCAMFGQCCFDVKREKQT